MGHHVRWAVEGWLHTEQLHGQHLEERGARGKQHSNDMVQMGNEHATERTVLVVIGAPIFTARMKDVRRHAFAYCNIAMSQLSTMQSRHAMACTSLE
jgi:hypothetical protein